jgi:hypothetical protein
MPHSARHPLQTLQVQNPCPTDWDAMTGDGRRRFCAHCQKHVHDLSAMSADEAERLICSAAAALCVRFARDPKTDQVVTLDYRPVPPASRRRAMVVFAAILTACGVSGAWATIRILHNPPPPPANHVLGEMLVPPQPNSSAGSSGQCSK